MGHGRFTDLYNPHWGRNVGNASFFWAGWVGEVVGNNVGNRKIRVLFANRTRFSTFLPSFFVRGDINIIGNKNSLYAHFSIYISFF